MKIKLEAELYEPAVPGQFYEIDRTVPRIVSVRLNGAEFVQVEVPATVEYSSAGHGDDSSFFRSEEERQITETLAPYLARIFGE